MRVEWWNSTSMLGAAAYRVPNYMYSFGGGYSGYYDACDYTGSYGS